MKPRSVPPDVYRRRRGKMLAHPEHQKVPQPPSTGLLERQARARARALRARAFRRRVRRLHRGR